MPVNTLNQRAARSKMHARILEILMRNLSRREFSMGLAGGMAGLRLTGSGEKLKPSIVGGIEIGVQSYTFRKFSLEKMIEAMRSAGISYVEMWDGHLNPMKATEADFKETRRRFDDAGITVGAYCVNFPVTANDEYLDRGFNGALLLGAKVMTSSVRKPLVPRLDEWCGKYKMKLGLHNHWFGEKWYRGDRTQEFETPQDFADALKGASPYLSINLDIGHFYAAGFDPVSYFREHHSRIVSLHLKDRDRDAEHTHKRFGQGATPIVEILREAKKVKFPYAANIEYEMEPDDPSGAVLECFQYLKRKLG